MNSFQSQKHHWYWSWGWCLHSQPVCSKCCLSLNISLKKLSQSQLCSWGYLFVKASAVIRNSGKKKYLELWVPPTPLEEEISPLTADQNLGSSKWVLLPCRQCFSGKSSVIVIQCQLKWMAFPYLLFPELNEGVHQN